MTVFKKFSPLCNHFLCVKVCFMRETLPRQQDGSIICVTPARVRRMVLDGTLLAEKFGRHLVIKSSDLALVADTSPLNRPPKAKLNQSNRKKKGGRK